MREIKLRPPFHFNLLDLGLPGRITGSAEPGGEIRLEIASAILERLNNGESLEELLLEEEVFKALGRLIANFEFLKKEGITTIYNLIPQYNDLVKFIWEKHYDGKYVTELGGFSIGFANGSSPSSELLKLISDDAISRMELGDNVLVHCAGGLGRTGTVLAAVYMVVLDSDYASSIDYIRNHHNKAAVDPGGQETALQQFETVKQEFRSANCSYENVEKAVLITHKPVAIHAQDNLPVNFSLIISSFTKLPGKKKSAVYIASNEQEDSNCVPNTQPSTANSSYESVQDAQESRSRVCVVSYMGSIRYSNPLLDNQEFQNCAVKLGKLAELINLGQDESVANAIIEAANENGTASTLSIILGRVSPNSNLQHGMTSSTLSESLPIPYNTTKSCKPAIISQEHVKGLTEHYNCNSRSISQSTRSK
jgi:protein-tyrosine phosphatase